MSYTDTTKLGLKKADPGTNQPFETDVFNDNLDAIDDEAIAVAASLTALDGRLDVVEANDWVTNARLATGAVGPDELQANAVTNSKLGFEAVAQSNLQPNSVGAAQLQSNSVGTSQLATNSVGPDEIQPGAVGNSELAGGLDASKLAFGTLNPTLLPANGIQASQLSNTLDLTSKTVYVSSSVGTYPYAAINSEVAKQIAQSYAEGAVIARNTPTLFASGSVTATPSSGLITVDLTGFGFTAAPVVTANIFGATTAKLIVTLNAVSATSVQFKVWTSTFANSTTSTRIDWQAVQTYV